MPDNMPPIALAVPDQQSPEDQAWSFQLPDDAFTDPDGDTLSFTAALESGDPLPDWLAFDAATRIFSGTPPPGL